MSDSNTTNSVCSNSVTPVGTDFISEFIKEDFTEYTFRIDVQMGLFWWYASKLSSLKEIKDEKISWAVLLLGLCYLTNF